MIHCRKEKIVQKVRKSAWRGWKGLVCLVALLLCMADFLPAEVSAAETRTDTQIDLLPGEDVYIT